MRLNDFAFESSEPRPLYVCRHVVNTDDIVAWAKSQGLTTMLEPSELHVTICFSSRPMSWDMPDTANEVIVPPISDFDEDHKPIRKMEMFGKEKNVLVLEIESDELHARWQEFLDHGASYDFSEYKPHITISYQAAELSGDLEFIEPYRGKIVFGPEVFKKIEQEWKDEPPEIDLTKPLGELIGKKEASEEEIAEQYTSFIGQNDVLVEHVEWAKGIRVTINPTLQQLENLCDQNDIRGVCDDRDVFVWDALQATHFEIMHELGIPPDYYANRFYAWMPSYGETEADWTEREESWLNSNDNVRIRAGSIIVSVRGPQYAHLMGLRPFSRMVKDRRVKEAHEEEHDGIRFWRNPSTKDLSGIMQQVHEEGLRGISDGHDVYVWNAYRAIHADAALLLGIDFQENWSRCFYVNHYDNGHSLAVAGSPYFLFVSCSSDQAKRELLSVPNFARMVQLPALVEEVQQTQKYFWFITNIPGWSEDGERKLNTARRLRELAEGTLTGLRGISGSREIVCEMLDIKGNTVVMMPAADVLQYNDIEQIQYDDPDFLARNDLSALYRLWDKDPHTKLGRDGLMTNLVRYVAGALKKSGNSRAAYDLENFMNPISRVYSDKPFVGIDNVKGLTSALEASIKDLVLAADQSGYRWYQENLRNLDFAELYEAVREALRYIGSLYASEDEWVIHGDTFHIPPGSRMLVSIETDILKAARTGDVTDLPLFKRSFVDSAKNVLGQIKAYDLAGRYELRFIPSEKFSRIRNTVQARRSKKKSLLS